MSDRASWHFTEPGGMASLEVQDEEGFVYLEAVSYGWHEDSRALLKIPKPEMKELAEWLLKHQ